jgi:acyl-coenzyme A thioesterase PaaI-like protein
VNEANEQRRLPAVYFPERSAKGESGDAKDRLADALRALVERCVTVDAGAAGAEALDALTAALDDVGARLATLPVVEVAAPNPAVSLAARGPFVGTANPLAAPLHLAIDGDMTRGWAVYGSAYEGGVGDLHGGVVAAAFDDLLGCAQMVGDTTGRTGTLTVRFRSPSPIGRRIDYEARLDRVEGRKVFCSGEAWCGDTLLAEAEAIFVAPRAAGPRTHTEV